MPAASERSPADSMPIFPSRGSIRLVELRQPCSTRVEALVLAGGRRQLLWFETDGPPVQESAEPFLPILLPAAMAAGLRLQIEAPVSAEVVAGAHRVSAVMASWYPRWGALQLEVPSPGGPVPITTESGPWGAFFSGGLDSFRTLQRFGHQLDYLLFVHGFDIPLSDPAKGDLVQAALTQVAAEVGPSLLTVRTNLRAFTDRWVSWEHHQCGGALAAVALLLAPHLSRVIIPSSFSRAFLHPYGSHPGLETLWSIPGLDVLHDSAREDRHDKAVAIAPWPLARRNLRVCWQPQTPGLNCGRCRKCLTTQSLLRGSCGGYDWPTFPQRLDLEALSRVRLNSPSMHSRFFSLRDHLRATGRDPELLSAVNQLLENQRRRSPGGPWHQRAVRVLARLPR